MILKYEKAREDVIIPTRSNPSDAGLDLYFNPNLISVTDYDREGACTRSVNGEMEFVSLTIKPGSARLLETGIKLEVPHGYMLEIKNRSSVACKKKLIVGACVVDSGYSGEILVNLINVGRRPVKIFPGDKIAQGVLIPIIPFRLFEAPIYEEPVSISKRGEGGFGSTDR